MGALSERRNLPGDLAWAGTHWQTIPFQTGACFKSHRTACFCFICWGSVEATLKGRVLRFKSPKDTGLGDLEGLNISTAW